MKEYLVDVWDENTYKKVFKANSKEEAEKKAREEIDDEGIEAGKNGWQTGFNADWGVLSVREVERKK